MSRRSIATPCPIPSSIDQLSTTAFDETTTAIDVTTAFRASFRDVKPRRKQRQSIQFAIHEDPKGDLGGYEPSRSSLSQPPRRIQTTSRSETCLSRHDQQNSDVVPRNISTSGEKHGSTTLGQCAKRPRARLSVLPESLVKNSTRCLMSPPTEVVRPARRGTIYIPNDDTTMPSMYMGIFSPIKDFDLHPTTDVGAEKLSDLTGIAAQMAAKRGTRTSAIGGAARRGTLQPILRPTQETMSIENRYGQGGGKENVPPDARYKKTLFEVSTTKVVSTSTRLCSARCSSKAPERPRVNASTASSLLKCELPKHPITREPLPKPAWNGGVNLKHSKCVQTAHKDHRPITLSPTIARVCKPQIPSRFVLPILQPETALQKYAPLQEDIRCPALYEEDWLQHQEIAITQLVNNLFSASKLDARHEHRLLRCQLLDIYNTDRISLMYKRLQPALLYGTLGIPQETLDQGARLQNDIGLRKQFTDLWLCTYEIRALQPAIEVVVGRECHSEQPISPAGSCPSPKLSRSALRAFIEAFLIRNEDGKPEPGAKNRAAWSYQRTLLRSLMLIKILDLTKSERGMSYSGCLFQRDSLHKTSCSVLQTLVRMLNPAVGDPVRVLNHINYSLSHSQHPLEEVNYEIANLAVDLRDGVRLTRLIELLLYPSSSQVLDRNFNDNTTTIIMPEGETIEFSDGQSWPLSQHLKMACQSRAVRLWNVQLALKALENVKGMDALIDGITADDIVDGFREKTIRLLWALVGKWGLSGLIDWQDLRWEIRRLEKRNIAFPNLDCYDDDLEEDNYSFETCKSLLKRWAGAVISSNGVSIRNFTTSFADGQAFKAIVNEYEPHIRNSTKTSQSTDRLSLHDHLIHLGCSTQFAQLFSLSPNQMQTHVFDHDFVIAALAFLCSRLLAPSRRGRAATVIQQAWQRHWTKTEHARKQVKRKVALACVDAVKCKEQRHDILSPATSISAHVTQPDIPAANMYLSHQTPGPMSPGAESDIWLNL